MLCCFREAVTREISTTTANGIVFMKQSPERFPRQQLMVEPSRFGEHKRMPEKLKKKKSDESENRLGLLCSTEQGLSLRVKSAKFKRQCKLFAVCHQCCP